MELSCYGEQCIIARAPLSAERGFFGLFRGTLSAFRPASKVRFEAARFTGCQVRTYVRKTGKTYTTRYALELEILPAAPAAAVSGTVSASRSKQPAPEVPEVSEVVLFYDYGDGEAAEETAMRIQAALFHARLEEARSASPDAASGGVSTADPPGSAGFWGFSSSPGSSSSSGSVGVDPAASGGAAVAKRYLTLHIRVETALWDELGLFVSLLVGCAPV